MIRQVDVAIALGSAKKRIIVHHSICIGADINDRSDNRKREKQFRFKNETSQASIPSFKRFL